MMIKIFHIMYYEIEICPNLLPAVTIGLNVAFCFKLIYKAKHLRICRGIYWMTGILHITHY